MQRCKLITIHWTERKKTTRECIEKKNLEKRKENIYRENKIPMCNIDDDDDCESESEHHLNTEQIPTG